MTEEAITVSEPENSEIHQANLPTRTVTSARQPGTPAAERKRQQRVRDRELRFIRDDWKVFVDPSGLPQKAGCQPHDLRPIVLRELVDNALDVGAHVTLERVGDTWIITDDGPGIDPADVPWLFTVNRPLETSKRKRLPLRGMLGNGLRVVAGAVAASEGSLQVETRGRCLSLAVNLTDGLTIVTNDQPAPDNGGLTVRIRLGDRLARGRRDDDYLARDAINIASHCGGYRGPSSPWWYSPHDLHILMQEVSPSDTTVAQLCLNLGLVLEDDRIARELSRNEAQAVLDLLRQGTKPVPPKELGAIGPSLFDDTCYACRFGDVYVRSVRIPCIVEAWASCTRSEKRGDGSVGVRLLLNRTPSVARIMGQSWSGGIRIDGCGMRKTIQGPRTGDYEVIVSVISPLIDLATDGKEPALAPYGETIAEVLAKACRAAHRAMEKPPGTMQIKEASWDAMTEAYDIASGGGKYPANARQIMYAARPAILKATGKSKLDDNYFTQTLLPDYMKAHVDETASWNIAFDARGTFTEPHTNRDVDLGTIEVHRYLGDRPSIVSEVELTPRDRFDTSGPVNRFRNILFIEKEGFGELLRVAQIAERFDIAIMSTKGMSVTAARILLDRLAQHIDRVMVLHDFDVTGFSIFGTLCGDGRRYTFTNNVPVIDIGLRLDDVKEMSLESEPVESSGDWDMRAATLRRHGASTEEIEFLKNQRVELNAMVAPVFVDFLERKLVEHGVCKVVPDSVTIEFHARRVIEQVLAEEALEKLKDELQEKSSAISLPDDLERQVANLLRDNPAIPWDHAVAQCVRAAVA